MNLENARNLQDAAFVASTTLPNANNSNVTTTSFNLNQSFSESEHFAVQIDIDPLANFGTTGALTATVQDSADNVTFTNIGLLGSVSVNANTTVTTTNQFRLPPTARQYVRAIAAISAINGNVAANNVTFSLRF